MNNPLAIILIAAVSLFIIWLAIWESCWLYAALPDSAQDEHRIMRSVIELELKNEQKMPP